jgi:hypothetical protein
MDSQLSNKIERFVQENITAFHAARIANIDRLRLADLLRNKNPYLFRARNLNSPTEFIKAILDARLSSSEEASFGKFLEDLAIFVAQETGGGQKSSTEGLDIDLTRGNIRYLIAVKSGKNWGNSTQHAKLKQYFASAVKVLKQSRWVGELQPTLGICYGKFATLNNGTYLHIGGQSFWHLLSGDAGLYTAIIEPLGHEALLHNKNFEGRQQAAYARFTQELTEKYSTLSGEIDWNKLVEMVSKNLQE